jgi:hypothetical protein
MRPPATGNGACGRPAGPRRDPAASRREPQITPAGPDRRAGRRISRSDRGPAAAAERDRNTGILNSLSPIPCGPLSRQLYGRARADCAVFWFLGRDCEYSLTDPLWSGCGTIAPGFSLAGDRMKGRIWRYYLRALAVMSSCDGEVSCRPGRRAEAGPGQWLAGGGRGAAALAGLRRLRLGLWLGRLNGVGAV